MYRIWLIPLSALIVILSPGTGFESAWAYPEMVRHGYVNCTSCHVSQTGGGVLTEYGRELSKEILSFTSREEEQKFIYGLVIPPSWLTMGGDFREIYVYKNSEFAKEGRAILMQADLEASAQVGKTRFVASAGFQDLKTAVTLADQLISRRHYLSYQLSDEWTVRGGRFLPAYGINTPDHVITIKRGLGFDQGQESYNIEASYIAEKLNIYATGIFGRPDNLGLNKETGIALSASRPFLLENSKWGASYLFGSKRFQPARHIFGPYIILGFSEKWALLSEFDFQSQGVPANAPSRFGALNYQKLSYEPIRGLWVYFTQEWSRLDFSREDTLSTAYTLGVQFFPRPHFELNVAWQKLRVASVSKEYMDLAWLLLHYYL